MQIQEESRSGITLLNLEGDLDREASAALKERIQGLIDARRQRLILDLAGVPTISSEGLSALQTALRTARTHGCEIRLAGLHGEAKRQFDQSGMGTQYRAFTNVDEAEVDFKLDVSERAEGDVTVVTVNGDLDAASAPGLEKKLRALVQDHRTRLALDLEGVTYIASAGFRALQSILLAARANGGELRIASVRPEVKEVFELTGFDQVLKLYDSLADAIGSFAA
jgi:anti-anti-sigma factor